MNRRIKALNTLHQVEERALEALSVQLSTAQNARAAAEARIDALGRRAQSEARCTDQEALPYVGRFMANLRREQARETATCEQLSGQIETLREGVMAHFTAGRTWEKLAGTLTSEILTARARAAEAALEDITQSRYGR